MIQFFIFRCNQQFNFNQQQKQWAKRNYQYFTIIDDGTQPMIYQPFKSIKIKDFKNKCQRLNNKYWHQSVGLLHLALNLDQLNYDYIGYLHADCLPLYLNNNSRIPPYPMMKARLLQVKELQKIQTDIFAFQPWPTFHFYKNFRKPYIQIQNKQFNGYSFCENFFNFHNLIENYKQIPVIFMGCLFLAKKQFLKYYLPIFDKLDYFFQPKVKKIDNNDFSGFASYLLENFSSTCIYQYSLNHKLSYVPICHFRNGESYKK